MLNNLPSNMQTHRNQGEECPPSSLTHSCYSSAVIFPNWFVRACTFLCLLAALSAANAVEPPVIPIGLDAYRQWDRWPCQRIGARAYMRSTYDRSGGNEGADASHFLYQLSDTNNVSLDVEGPGVLYFARYNHWHGSPWHYVVDGIDHLVRETTTSDPTKPVADSVFLPADSFPPPMAVTWSTTKGADLTWVPIPFGKSFRMAYSRTRYGTGYYIYHQYVGGAKLSQPIRAWNAEAPDQDVLDLIGRAGTDLAPTDARTEGAPLAKLAPKETRTVLVLDHAPATIRKLGFSVPLDQALAFGRAWLRLTWDDRKEPSVFAPVALFFGAGTLYNRDSREYLVKAFPSYIRFGPERVELACFFPMPFFKSARIELIGPPDESVNGVVWDIRHLPLKDSPRDVGYFHATYRDHPNPELGHDLVLLDTCQAEGGGDWAGNFVGTSFIFSDRAFLGTLEGDPRFFFDDSQTPQAYGTGTEEWGGGGDYWGGRNMTLPFAGHPLGARNEKEAKNDLDKIESAYRFLLADLMPFGKNAIIRLEHGGIDNSTEHYQTVTYWYGAPAPALVQTDELKVGDTASESAHRYVSPQACTPYEITSRYEWGVDTVPGADRKPMPHPADYAEFEFQAKAGQKYYIWVRGVNLDGPNTSHASWLQFDQDIGTAKLGPTYNHAKGFGNWSDQPPARAYAWSSALPQDPPQTITFSEGGRHKLRIQPRQPRHYLEGIWLSATQTTLPATNAAPVPGEDEIVLKAADATRLHGLVKLVADASAGTGKVLDINSAAGAEVYPPHTDRGRKTPGRSEFMLKLNPANYGVLLRRKLDYALPNQRAEVFVADGSKEPGESDWKAAGIWYLAGANTCVYSNPKGELGVTEHKVQTSNRRFRDDEFLVPRSLTEGRSAIRVRVQFTPVETPLFPGHPLAELAWSEIRYNVYCFVLPEWRP
jgi:hypothetical protein